MAGHLIPAGHSLTRAAAPAGAWLALSAALTGQVPGLAGRDDLIVTCAPGAGRGSPACYLPALAAIEVDGTHLGVDPATADPASPADRERYPATWGALVHEAAHAAHSRWAGALPATTPPAWTEAATLLEESRIEAAHLARRPGDRRWLRASATTFVLDDFPAGGTPPGHWYAASAAGLLLARTDAGVLDPSETDPVHAVVTAVLGERRLAALRAVWQTAHAAADSDTRTMLTLGRRWCRIVGTDPDIPRPAGTAPSARTPLDDAITAAVAAVTAADEPLPPVPPARTALRTTENAARAEAARAARRVFAGTGSGGAAAASRIRGTRPPEPAEQTAARRLAAALRASASRDRTATVISSPVPPGRLRMREVLAADAQRAAGAMPTAAPFTRTIRRHQPSPPLRAGIACDVSGSMSAFAGPAASAAWILARAAEVIPGTLTATVIYGATVTAITRPGEPARRVTEFTAADGTEKFCRAVDALDHALGLSQRGAARLLVIISDGCYTTDERDGGRQRLIRLTRSGCAILWLAPGTGWAEPMPGAHVTVLTDPAATATEIARAAARALAEA